MIRKLLQTSAIILGISVVDANANQKECKIPDGTYKNTCQNIKVASDDDGQNCILTASCQYISRGAPMKPFKILYKYSSLTLMDSSGDIKNCAGTLKYSNCLGD